MKVQSGIYTISEGTTILYVGGSSNVCERIGNHRHRLKTGTHPSSVLRAAYARGVLDFRKILVCAKKDLRFFEQRALDAWKPAGNSCKIAGSPLGLKQSAATREKKRQALLGWVPPRSTIEAGAASRRGKPLTAEHRQKIGAGVSASLRLKEK